MMPMRESGGQEGFLHAWKTETLFILNQALFGIERKSLGIFRIEVKQRFLT